MRPQNSRAIRRESEAKGRDAVAAASSASIAITATHNAIQDDGNVSERKQLTVAADYGLATQVTETAEWVVTNVHGFT